MAKSTSNTIASDKQADEVRARLDEHRATLATIGEQIVQNDAEIERLMLSEALGTKADPKALEGLEATSAALARQLKHAKVVEAGMIAMIDTWEAAEGERDYLALIPRAEELYAEGERLTQEYLSDAMSMVPKGRRLTQVHNEHYALLRLMAEMGRELAPQAFQRIRLQTPAGQRTAPPAFPITDFLLSPTLGETLEPAQIASYGSAYWRDVLGIPTPGYVGPEEDEEAVDGDEDIELAATNEPDEDGVVIEEWDIEDGSDAA